MKKEKNTLVICIKFVNKSTLDKFDAGCVVFEKKFMNSLNDVRLIFKSAASWPSSLLFQQIDWRLYFIYSGSQINFNALYFTTFFMILPS